MDLRMSRQSKEYIYVPVTASADPTSLPVFIAIKAVGTEPVSGDYKTAEWEPGTTKARLLIGPGSTFGELTPGNYLVWVKIDGAVEDPVMKAKSTLVIYAT